MTGKLHGKTVLITGGGSGVGRGAAYAMADEGARVAAAGRTLSKCEETVAEIERRGGTAIAIEADVLQADHIERMVATVLDTWGRLDVIVHSAQAILYAPLDVARPEDLDEMWQSGPLAALRLMQAALPALSESKGVIVTISSGAGLNPPHSLAGYAAVKEAMRSLTRAAACEWGPRGIRAVAVCPFSDTPGLADFQAALGVSRDSILSAAPLGRVGDPEKDIGRVIAFVASDEASYITGTTLMVDGGAGYLR
jgi:NAD(P)-dependent dehydrogenase (short-subunit alcohol dehydrogenase family)